MIAERKTPIKLPDQSVWADESHRIPDIPAQGF